VPPIGDIDYRDGARERLEEALLLLQQERFGGSIYLAGRAVEGMLRAVIWKTDPEYATGKKMLMTGHDLREILKLVRNLGALRDQEFRNSIAADVQTIGRLWWNNIRFIPTAKIGKRWYDLKEIGGKRTIKQAAGDFYDACSAVVKRCEAIWRAPT
jgi:hypothetical protein